MFYQIVFNNHEFTQETYDDYIYSSAEKAIADAKPRLNSGEYGSYSIITLTFKWNFHST